jgi:hypothetical protein
MAVREKQKHWFGFNHFSVLFFYFYNIISYKLYNCLRSTTNT